MSVASSLYGGPLHAQASGADAASFGFSDVTEIARTLSKGTHQPSTMALRGPFADLDYDRYRGIRFREGARPIDGSGSAFALDLLPPGHVYRHRVRVSIVRPGGIETIEFSPDMFEFDPEKFNLADGKAPAQNADGLGFSGFRLRYPLNSPDVLDEFLVFQGASYFRAVARDMIYGLSARGLAIGTADPRGEEFPIFTEFWIHEPRADARHVLVDALLQSASCTGAFEFEIRPGETTVIETRCRLFPRVEIEQIGIAPLTSMYFYGPERRAGVDDFRDAVHDSSGLQMITGQGRRLWRQLSNPTRVQISAFLDQNPKGFGLSQRHRDFDFFQDDEARYDKRPSAWIEPLGQWGAGAVMLVEIPVANEFNDNIVAFWRPAEPLAPTEDGHEFAYRLHWLDEPPDARPLARVEATRAGRSIHNSAERVFVVDFEAGNVSHLDLQPKVWASVGTVKGVDLRSVPQGNLLRASFNFDPSGADSAELQLTLENEQGSVSETWLYRWTER